MGNQQPKPKPDKKIKIGASNKEVLLSEITERELFLEFERMVKLSINDGKIYAGLQIVCEQLEEKRNKSEWHQKYEPNLKMWIA